MQLLMMVTKHIATAGTWGLNYLMYKRRTVVGEPPIYRSRCAGNALIDPDGGP